MRIGGDLHENQLFMKNVVLSLFWSFLDLLDLKNGSSSKFYAEKWCQEVWKSKLKPFRGKSMTFYINLTYSPGHLVLQGVVVFQMLSFTRIVWSFVGHFVGDV